jgi:RNA polymerase sigma-70 factor (ECF subfamily)
LENTKKLWNMAELSVSKLTDVQKVTVEDSAPGGECDSELIERYLSGSEEGFNRLVMRHQRRAINLAYRFSGNYEDACDIAQEAFLRVHKSLRRFKGNCSFKTWLYKIVLNLSRNKYRWKKRRGEFGKVSIDNPGKGENRNPMEIPDGSLSVGREVRRKEIEGRIQESLARLPKSYREILVLRHMEGLSYSDISGLLRCAEGTIKSRLHRARVEIRKLLADMVES